MQKTFKVLPTDERFKALTEEQVFLMREHQLVDDPELDKQNSDMFTDPEYERAEQNLDVDQRAMDAREEPDLRPIKPGLR